MKRHLVRALLYALAALVLVIGYAELRTFGEVEVTLQDESGRIMTTTFPAMLCSSLSDEMTVIRNGHLCHYQFNYHTVLHHGALGLAINYHGTRDGLKTASNQTLPFTPANIDDAHQWTPLDDHLLASVSLR